MTQGAILEVRCSPGDRAVAEEKQKKEEEVMSKERSCVCLAARSEYQRLCVKKGEAMFAKHL